MSENFRDNELTAEEKEKLRKWSKSSSETVEYGSISISKAAIDRTSELIGYLDEKRHDDPYFITRNATRFAEDFISILKPDNKNDYPGELLSEIGEALSARYEGDVVEINAALVGMSVVIGSAHHDYGSEFIDEIKKISEDDVFDTFNEYGKFLSERTLIERSLGEKIPTFKNEQLTALLDDLYTDFDYVSKSGDQVKDGAEFGYFFMNRNFSQFQEE